MGAPLGGPAPRRGAGGVMSPLGQSRYFDSAPRASALRRSADIADQVGQVRKVPTGDSCTAANKPVTSSRWGSLRIASFARQLERDAPSRVRLRSG
jgi:hypothetical protein